MNFTSDIKKELINKGLAEKISGLSAFVKTCGTVGIKAGSPTIFLVSETENVAEFFMRIFYETFETELSVTHATMDRMSGRDKLVLQCPPAFAAEALRLLGLLKKDGKDFKTGIARTLVKDEESGIAYIRGAFLGGGSCMLPSANGAGYHLEIVFSEKKTAQDFCDLLASFEVIAKLAVRKETYVVYIKSKELISDFLSVIGAL